MITVDHICLGVQNLYEGTFRLREETGFGDYDGGWFPTSSLANRIVPLGNDTYIEVESVIDAHKLRQGDPTSVWFDDCVRSGDVFIGWCARVDTRAELDRIAKRLNENVLEDALKRSPDGRLAAGVARVPGAVPCWKAGRPNFFYFPEMDTHPARLTPTSPVSNPPLGLSYLELGGTAEEMSDWLGLPAEQLPVRFNGQAEGLYAVVVNTASGPVTIRRPNHRSPKLST